MWMLERLNLESPRHIQGTYELHLFYNHDDIMWYSYYAFLQQYIISWFICSLLCCSIPGQSRSGAPEVNLSFNFMIDKLVTMDSAEDLPSRRLPQRQWTTSTSYDVHRTKYLPVKEMDLWTLSALQHLQEVFGDAAHTWSPDQSEVYRQPKALYEGWLLHAQITIAP